MNSFAPVVIPTLNRHIHFKRCVESLSRCTHADKTDLFIAFDYPLTESHWEGYRKIEKYVNEIKGFNSVNIIKRDKNFGAMENYLKSTSEIFENHDRIIFSEDDNEFSPNFLDYINKGLDKFGPDPNVSAICGYKHPIEIPRNYSFNYFFYRGFSAWGYGTWKEKFIQPYYSTENLIEFIRNNENVKELKKISNRHYYNILHSILKKETKSGDFTVFLNNITHNQLCIFPSVSLVRNYGHDGSGINCGTLNSNIFSNQTIDNNKYFEYHDLVPIEDTTIKQNFKKYFKISRKAKIRGIIHRLFFFLFKNY